MRMNKIAWSNKSTIKRIYTTKKYKENCKKIFFKIDFSVNDNTKNRFFFFFFWHIVKFFLGETE